MRVGIIGGGAAGLTTAWLLADQHDVTLFEQQPQLGGHAHTLHIDEDGKSVAVEAGFEFFSRKLWPTFNRLLGQLGVTLRDYPMRLSVRRPGDAHARHLQPLDIAGRLVPSMVTPRRVAELAQFALLLASVRPLMTARDTSITLQQALSRVPLARSFRDDFVFPFLLSGWCVEPEEFREFSAYDVLRYAYMGVTPQGSIAMQEVVGGLARYVEALVAQIPRASLRVPAEIAGIERTADGFSVHEADGRTHRFEQLVLATNARAAAKLLTGVRGAERAVELSSRIEYFRTVIAVHGDASFMPARKDDWAIVNVRHDDRYAHTTVWKPWRGAKLFRSWVTYEQRMPEQLHGLVHFEHPKVLVSYFAVQRALQQVQGQGGLWLAGMHMDDIDSHESAVRSAVRVVQRLAPDAPRLKLIA